MKWPAALPAGKVVEEPVTSLDLLPTFAAIAGAEQVEGAQGLQLVPYLTNADMTIPARDFFWRRGHMTQNAVRSGDYKWLMNQNKNLEFLYNVQEDPSERNNLLKTQPELAEPFRKQYRAWEAVVPEPAFQSDWRPKNR